MTYRRTKQLIDFMGDGNPLINGGMFVFDNETIEYLEVTGEFESGIYVYQIRNSKTKYAFKTKPYINPAMRKLGASEDQLDRAKMYWHIIENRGPDGFDDSPLYLAYKEACVRYLPYLNTGLFEMEVPSDVIAEAVYTRLNPDAKGEEGITYKYDSVTKQWVPQE